MTEELEGIPYRISLARRTLDASPYEEWPEDQEAVITDLLTDLMHFCGQESLDFEALLTRARRHYQAEVEGEHGKAN